MAVVHSSLDPALAWSSYFLSGAISTDRTGFFRSLLQTCVRKQLSLFFHYFLYTTRWCREQEVIGWWSIYWKHNRRLYLDSEKYIFFSIKAVNPPLSSNWQPLSKDGFVTPSPPTHTHASGHTHTFVFLLNVKVNVPESETSKLHLDAMSKGVYTCILNTLSMPSAVTDKQIQNSIIIINGIWQLLFFTFFRSTFIISENNTVCDIHFLYIVKNSKPLLVIKYKKDYKML